MRTEEQIVYQLLNIYHGGSVSNDNVVNERLMRSFLRKHRASKLYKFSKNGLFISSEVFQSIGNIVCEKVTGKNDYVYQLPALIYLDGYGIRLFKDEYAIPVVTRNNYRLSKMNIINSGFPKATIVQQNLNVFPGIDQSTCRTDSESLKEQTVAKFAIEIAEFNDNERITVEVEAVLYDPDDGDQYDWTSDPYPCPSEIVDQLTTSAAAKDLNLMIRQFVDQNVNAKEDKVEINEGV